MRVLWDLGHVGWNVRGTEWEGSRVWEGRGNAGRIYHGFYLDENGGDGGRRLYDFLISNVCIWGYVWSEGKGVLDWVFIFLPLLSKRKYILHH